MKTLKNNKGFTLIELIVVIAILGVLALILVPQFMGYVDDADIQTQRANTKAVYDSSVAAIAKLKTIPKADRTWDKVGEFIQDGLGDSFKGRYKAVIQDSPMYAFGASGVRVTFSGISNGSIGFSMKEPLTVNEVSFDGCVYTPSTNTYSGTCADVTGN